MLCITLKQVSNTIEIKLPDGKKISVILIKQKGSNQSVMGVIAPEEIKVTRGLFKHLENRGNI